MEAGEEDVLRRRHGAPRSSVLLVPESAELPQLVGGEGIGRAGVAPAHVPGVLEEQRPHLLLFDLLAEHRLVEGAELVLDEQGDLGVRGEADGAVVGGLDPPLAGEGIDEQLLGAGGVDHAEADGEHELGALVGHLQRPQVGEAELRLLAEVHLGDEEPHPLLEIAAEHARGARGDPVAVLGQPGLQPLALLGREDQDVVLAHRVLRLDGHAEALGAVLPPAAADDAPFHGGRLHRHRVDRLARVAVEVLDQPRGRVGVEVVEQGPLGDVDLLLLEEGRDGDDDGELLRIPLEVVGHGEDGAVAVARQDDLRGLVEQLWCRPSRHRSRRSRGRCGRPSPARRW